MYSVTEIFQSPTFVIECSAKTATILVKTLNIITLLLIKINATLQVFFLFLFLSKVIHKQPNLGQTL
jgi:hypothetical protein